MRATIIKYFEGKVNENELMELFDWLQDTANKQQFNEIKSEWENNRIGQSVSSENLRGWANIQSKLFQASENKQHRQIKFNLFFRYAAIFIVLISIPSLWYYLQKDQAETLTRFTTVSANTGQVTKIFLPDGSEVWLNYGSSIKYDNLFSKENRNIKLEGEAFFKAAKNKELPMVVSCAELRVKVVGTCFNVMSYREDGNIHVTLEEGTVLLYDDSKPSEVIKMKPGEMGTYSKSNKQINIDTVNTDLYTSWKDGVINIYNLTLEELVLKLERRYNQKFEIDKAARSLRYTLTIKNETLHQVLDLLRIINSVDPVQKDDVIYLKYNPQRAKEMNQDK
jgi:ferric-dicitrate binding protein FerR (iron transport regulator)